MAQRTIKNYTNEDLIIRDLGDLTIPANSAVDIGGNESRLLELASSEDLLAALAQGIEKYQINDGNRDLNFSNGIDLIRKIQRPTETDELGRWVVRADSRKSGYDVAFCGQGDDLQTGRIGEGTPFLWDFSAPAQDPRWVTSETDPTIPNGYKRQKIRWFFSDWVFVKEGTLYFFNAPKGTYLNFRVIAPPNTFFTRKKLDDHQNAILNIFPSGDQFVPFLHWVINYYIEGSAPMGDELNTESAADNPAYPGLIWECELTAPDVNNISEFHGHFSLEVYRITQDDQDIPELYR